MEKYYAVLDQKNIIFGVGKTKKEARKDAEFWHKENGPAFKPFKPTLECTKAIFKDGETGEERSYINGVICTKKEYREYFYENEISIEEFASNDNIQDKLNLIYKKLCSDK